MPSSDPAKRREQQARRRATKKQAASDGAAGAFHQHQAAAGTSTSVGNSSSSNDPGAADQPSSTGLLSETEAELQRQELQREVLTAEFEPEQSAEPLPAWRAKHRPPMMSTMPDGEERLLPRLADYCHFGKPDLRSAAAKEWGYQPALGQRHRRQSWRTVHHGAANHVGRTHRTCGSCSCSLKSTAGCQHQVQSAHEHGRAR